jgi:hypothetical protein
VRSAASEKKVAIPDLRALKPCLKQAAEKGRQWEQAAEISINK